MQFAKGAFNSLGSSSRKDDVEILSQTVCVCRDLQLCGKQHLVQILPFTIIYSYLGSFPTAMDFYAVYTVLLITTAPN